MAQSKLTKFLGYAFAFCLTLVLIAGGFVAWKLYPHDAPQPLNAPLASLDSEVGQIRLGQSTFTIDHVRLSNTFQAQQLISYCGVASSVSVLNALGRGASQMGYFISGADKIRSQLQVMFGGMSLSHLVGLIELHGVKAQAVYADDLNLDGFRGIIKRNLATQDDYLLVNYQREVLGQGRVGHISPISAYHAESDSVLLLDTAAHKYPPTWVPVELLFAAMNTTDADSGKSRGLVEVMTL